MVNLEKIVGQEEIVAISLHKTEKITYKPEFNLILTSTYKPSGFSEDMRDKLTIIKLNNYVHNPHFSERILEKHVDEVFTVIVDSLKPTC